MKSIGIAGAGLCGRLLAWRLARLGHTVTLFDQDNRDGHASCGWAAAGMLSPLAELEVGNETLYQQGLRSLALWPEWLSELNHPVTFKQQGSWVIAHPQDWADVERLQQLMQKNLGAQIPAKLLNTTEIKTLEPDLNPLGSRALFLENEGYLCPTELYNALNDALKDIDWRENTTVTDSQAFQITTKDQTFRFDHVIDCRGLGAKSSFPNLRGVRGELIWLQTDEVILTRPVRLIHPRYRVYIVPHPNNTYLVGASEIESESMAPISVRTTLELLSAAYSVHPAFAEAKILKTVVNCRPALPDNLPKIIHQPGFSAINGLYRHGYLLAPALIEELIETTLVEL